MDNLTHTLVAITAARAGLARAGRGATAAFILASNAPDADIVALAGGGLAYLDAHRGLTHGPPGAAALALLSAAIVRVCVRTSRLAPLIAVSLCGTALHVLMDLPTSYGTRVLSPWCQTWFAFDWMPIIDVYLWIVLLAALGIARWRPALRRRAAFAALAFAVADYGTRAALHEVVVRRAAAEERIGLDCADRGLTRWDGGAGASQGCEVRAAALPTFFSPFTWRIVRVADTDVRVRELRVIGAPARRESVQLWRAPPELADRSRAGPIARAFLRFARFPTPRLLSSASGGAVLRWEDARFLFDLQRADPRTTFMVSVELDAAGRVVAEHYGR